jgi:hypothetical protein
VPRKRYFYVDETGQDTQGQLFIVAVVIAEQDLDLWRAACEEIERLSRKGRVKWTLATPDRRLAYMRLVLQSPLFASRLTFARYTEARDYPGLTTQTIALAVRYAGEDGDNVILIDGLPKERWKDYGRWIRQRGVKVWKVRGVRRDENDTLIRLADAVCGFVRAAYAGQPEMKALFDVAMRQGRIKDLRG